MPFLPLLSLKRSSYIISVTAERSKWIDKLRGNIADLLAVCGSIHMNQADKISVVALTKRSDADRLIALITLQLDPFDKSGIDRNLIILLPKLVQFSEKTSDEYRGLEQQFIQHAQFLLKEEWEKVKSEAKGTTLAWFTGATCKRRKRAEEYSKFCNAGYAKGFSSH